MIIITHANCTDGLGAEWVLRRAFPGATHIKANHGDDIPDVTDRDVIMADFTYPADQMIEIADKCNTLRVYDHHESGEERCKAIENHPNVLEVIFDMQRSGAGIVWDRFKPQVHLAMTDENNRPWVINFIEDVDLWRDRYMKSRQVVEGIRFEGSTLETLDKAASNPQKYSDMGEIILENKRRLVKEAARMSRLDRLGGTVVRVCNAPYFLSSELGHELCKDSPSGVGVVWFQDENCNYKLSLRSENGEAKKLLDDFQYDPFILSSGGHPNACGILMSYNPFE